MIPDIIRRALGLPLILRTPAPPPPVPRSLMAVYRPRDRAVCLITRAGAIAIPADDVPGAIAALQTALDTRDLAQVMMASRLQ